MFELRKSGVTRLTACRRGVRVEPLSLLVTYDGYGRRFRCERNSDASEFSKELYCRDEDGRMQPLQDGTQKEATAYWLYVKTWQEQKAYYQV